MRPGDAAAKTEAASDPAVVQDPSQNWLEKFFEFQAQDHQVHSDQSHHCSFSRNLQSNPTWFAITHVRESCCRLSGVAVCRYVLSNAPVLDRRGYPMYGSYASIPDKQAVRII